MTFRESRGMIFVGSWSCPPWPARFSLLRVSVTSTDFEGLFSGSPLRCVVPARGAIPLPSAMQKSRVTLHPLSTPKSGPRRDFFYELSMRLL